MVVMFVDCCVGCGMYFRYYSYSRNHMGWKCFDPAGTLIALNLLRQCLLCFLTGIAFICHPPFLATDTQTYEYH
jgi:hypothetical protein